MSKLRGFVGWGEVEGFHADLGEGQLLTVERILRLNFILEPSQQKVSVSSNLI